MGFRYTKALDSPSRPRSPLSMKTLPRRNSDAISYKTETRITAALLASDQRQFELPLGDNLLRFPN